VAALGTHIVPALGARRSALLAPRDGRALCCPGARPESKVEMAMVTNTDQKLELLKRTPLLEGLGRRDLEEVGRLADEVDVAAGHVLMREGDPGREFFVIVDGSVRVERGGSVLATLGPGDFLGEIALIDEGPRTATATTETPATLLVLAHREFHSLMAQFESVRTCVLHCLAERLREYEPHAIN
jgi:CRP-like cAMP-binding protein